MNKTGLFIMGGSSYYTLLLFESLKSQSVAEGLSVITLFGRNKQRLNLIAEIGNSILAGVTPVDVSVNLEDCLNNKYGLIFNQIRFGGMSSRDRDEKLALANDLAADETIGIVGVSNAIRTVKGMTPYLDIIKKKKSAYKFINFTNPCSILTQYMVENFNIPAIGICDYPQMMRLKIADRLALDADELQFGYFGLNHFGVIYSVKHHGEELITQLLSLQTKLAFKPKCNRYFKHLLNVSWSFVYERQELVKEQKKTTNRAAQLLDFEKHMDELLLRGEREANVYFDVLNQRNCDWFNLVVSPLFANLLSQKKYACHCQYTDKRPFKYR
jgi:6-phospho-beta-glucosidase